MRSATRTAQRWITAAALAGAFGFGGAQALAAPRELEGPGTCNPGQCQISCRAMGAVRSECHDGQCACLFITP
ncbi:MAG TPA: hypothetical protein VF746_30735 [Longimicrobium sp.]